MQSRRWIIVALFVVLTALGVIANLLVALHATQANGKVGALLMSSAEEEPQQWPTDPPLANLWPESPLLTQRQEWTDAVKLNAWAGIPTTHQMEVHQYGWPVGVLQRAQFWWPWEDPKYAGAGPRETGIVVLWLNLCASSASLAAFITLFLEGIPWWIERRRTRQGRCVQCGYHLRSPAPQCSECGHDRSRGRRRFLDRPLALLAPSPTITRVNNIKSEPEN